MYAPREGVLFYLNASSWSVCLSVSLFVHGCHYRRRVRAVLVAVATSVEHARDMAVSAALQGDAGEFLRWLESCAKGSDGDTRELAEFVLGNGDVQALASLVAHA